MRAVIYLDPSGGAAGDMFLGALLAAGLSEADLRRAVGSLPLSGFDLEVRTETRRSLVATRVLVDVGEDAERPHRRLADVEAIIDGADLPGRSAETARRVFRRLAEAEAKVHGTTPDAVHFHEVGAVDSIVDIVGTCAGLELLGAGRVTSGPVATGGGTVEAAHGRLPVPAPAVLELLRGVPTRPSGETHEMVTPTGAALLVALAESFGPMPAMVVEAVGYGAGSRQGQRVPNLLRVVVGRAVEDPSAAEADAVWQVETNLDDARGEAVADAARALFQAGALDVWTTPGGMKKGRPGLVLSCLAEPGALASVEEAMLRHTLTFGVRRWLVERTKLAREHIEVETPYGTVRVKVGRRGGRILAARPEYEDCARRAREAGVPLETVYEAALAARPRRDPEAEGEAT